MASGDFRVATFDCYGTLIDWEAGILASLRPLAGAEVRLFAARAALPGTVPAGETPKYQPTTSGGHLRAQFLRTQVEAP